MITVAVVAFLVGGGIESRRLSLRSRYYRNLAVEARNDRADERVRLARFDLLLQNVKGALANDLPHEQRELVQRAAEELASANAARAKRVAHFGRLQQNYERVARYPWLPAERDPPPPE